MYLTWDTTEITRAYDDGDYGPYPRKIGVSVFKIPPFDGSSGIPACTLYYYQDAHSGDADLLVNSWWFESMSWPPYPSQPYYNAMFLAIWNSTDTVATDSTRTNDDDWYKVPLTTAACAAIADSATYYYEYHEGDSCTFYMGWVYGGTEDEYYTDVSGTYASNPPYIKVVYED